MLIKQEKNQARQKRHLRVRNHIAGTAARPRLNVFRSLKNIYAQIIDDEKGVTLVSASSKDKGFSHPVVVEPPEGITFECPSATVITISGINKEVVGQTAAEIRAHREPEPYKGKGIKYAGEHVRRKEGKAGAKGKK